MGVNALNTTTKEQVFGVTVSAVKVRQVNDGFLFRQCKLVWALLSKTC